MVPYGVGKEVEKSMFEFEFEKDVEDASVVGGAKSGAWRNCPVDVLTVNRNG